MYMYVMLKFFTIMFTMYGTYILYSVHFMYIDIDLQPHDFCYYNSLCDIYTNILFFL